MLQAQLQRSDTSVIKPDLSRGQGMKVWRTVSGIVFCILYVLTFSPPSCGGLLFSCSRYCDWEAGSLGKFVRMEKCGDMACSVANSICTNSPERTAERLVFKLSILRYM